MILREVKQAEDPCEVKNFPRFICLRIPESDRHFWSPRLNLSLEEEEDGTTRIEGIYGPNANVWGLLLYGYLIIGSAGLFSGILGYAQWFIGSRPWGLWICGAMLAAAIALYVAARMGRKIGAPQTMLLHRIYESAMHRTAEIH